MTDEQQPSGECKCCDTTLTGDDLTYRVLYGKFHQARDGVVSEKQIAGPNEELDPGVDERYYCFDCYKEKYDRENGAHYRYDTADELWDILAAADGRLIADAKPMTVGGRGWFRIVDGEVEARYSVRVEGGEDDDWDVGFDTEPNGDFDEDDFYEFFSDNGDMQLVYLKPVDETPFVAGMNRTLGVNYED